ncbi:Collagen Alpha-5(Vi) Chain, partial [Manis pentadactyla]
PRGACAPPPPPPAGSTTTSRAAPPRLPPRLREREPRCRPRGAEPPAPGPRGPADEPPTAAVRGRRGRAGWRGAAGSAGNGERRGGEGGLGAWKGGSGRGDGRSGRGGARRRRVGARELLEGRCITGAFGGPAADARVNMTGPEQVGENGDGGGGSTAGRTAEGSRERVRPGQLRSVTGASTAVSGRCKSVATAFGEDL